MYTANNQPAPANGASVVGQPMPTIRTKGMLFRNVETDQKVVIDGGKEVPEWKLDDDGRIVQEPVNLNQETGIYDAKLHDSVVIKNWAHLAMINPAEAMAKLDKLNSMLPDGLRIAPRKGAQANYALSQQLGRPINTYISSTGSWLGWIAKSEGSPSNPHAVDL
tara:strand:+ start:238 stop:729 length:492 start_codon:yes stop_codon:yes gene_type:complete